MSYLDVDTILSEDERIPCTFRLDAIGMGHLDASVDSEDLPAQTRLELPLWLATVLSKKQMTDLHLPKHFERKMRDEILAGAEHINFREFSNYFYEVGCQLAKEWDNEDLKKTLQIAFAGGKFRSLMMYSLQSWNDDVTEFSQSLTNMEAKIFFAGLKTSKDLYQWRVKRSSAAFLKSSSILGRRSADQMNAANGIATIGPNKRIA